MNKLLFAVAAAAALTSAVGWKRKRGCTCCGCHCEPVKVCAVSCEVKKVPKICYGSECEDICVPGPSTLCGEHCQCQDDPCRPGCTIRRRVLDWIPGCAYVKTRAKLTKTEVEVEQKVYSWKIVELCPSCAQRCCRHGGRMADHPPRRQPTAEEIAAAETPEDVLAASVDEPLR